MITTAEERPDQFPIANESIVATNSAVVLPVSPSFTVFCIIAGEDAPFLVDIGLDATVDHLKKAIKAHIPEFAEIHARWLDLFLVNLPDDEELTSGVERFLRNSTARLRVTKKLLDLENIREENLVHILVQLRQNRFPTIPRPQDLPTVQAKIAEFLNELRPKIKAFLNTSPRLPYWAPSASVNNEAREFYEELKIPTLKGKPSLLLDNVTKGLSNSTSGLFEQGSTILCNVSGSGKTRALLAGLFDHWGFYFTAAQSPEAVGSKDLVNAIARMPKVAGWIKDVFLDQPTAAHVRERNQENVAIASRELAKVIFARYAIFELFVEEAREKYGSLPEHLKGDWTLFQCVPVTGVDVFVALIDDCLDGVDENLLKELRRFYPYKILGDDPPPGAFYFVLDEVQVAGEAHMGCFSDANGNLPKPVLPIFITQITRTNRHTVLLSGTSFSLDRTTTFTPTWSFGKPSGWMVTYVLDDLSERSVQEEYIRRYLPATFLATESGMLVLDRMWESFRGRPQLTVRVLEELLLSPWQSNGPTSPIRIMNACIKAWTGYDALPYHLDVSKEPQIGEIAAIDLFRWDKLKTETSLESLLEERLYTWLTEGKPLILGAKETKLVTYGLGRFTYTLGPQLFVVIDEPLALSICHHLLGQQSLGTPEPIVTSTTGNTAVRRLKRMRPKHKAPLPPAKRRRTATIL